jgi:hypothetical protein
MHNLLQVTGVCGLFLAFFYLYPTFLVAKYAYMGFTMIPFEGPKLVLCILLFLLSFVYVGSKQSLFLKNSSLFFQVFFLLPNLVFYSYNEMSILPSVAVTFLIFLLNLPFPKLSQIGVLTPKPLEVLILLLAIALPIFGVVISLYPVSFNTDLLKFGKAIYEVRERNASVVNSTFISYTLSPLVKVVLPILVLYLIEKRKFLLSLGVVLIITSLFFITAKKGVFFGLILVLFFAFVNHYRKQASLFVFGLLAVIGTGMILNANGNLMVNSLVVRRVFFLPAYLNWAYLDFFSGENLYYGYSFLSHFVHYPFDAEPAILIGREYFYTSSGYANNGFISDALINLGVVGLFLVVSLVALIFRFFNALNLGPIYFGVFFIFLFALLSTGFFTVMFTHGGLWLLAVAYIISKSKKRKLGSPNPNGK